jgi:hypothetical protein
MDMPQLDNYLVTLGVKGQNVVLSQMDKIRKGKKELSKKVTVDLTTKGGKGGAPTAPEKLYEQEKRENEKVKKTHKEESDREKKNTSSFKEAAGKFGSGVQNFASAASSIDPVSTLASVTSAIGTSLSGISVLGISLGRLPEGIAQITNSTVAMAKNAVDMAKQATAGYYALATRNAAASHYGGNITEGSQLSKNERAMLIEAVSGSMGKIQPELAKEINKLVGGKDTRALARVAGGDWESTGTDKGWMLGQLMSGVQGLPPSIKQRFQASLLSRNSDLIQGITGDQANAQGNAATFSNMEEKQTERLYRGSLKGGQTDKNLIGMINSLNNMQAGLYTAGITFAKSIDKAVVAVLELPKTIDKVKKNIDDTLNSSAVSRVTSKIGIGNAVKTMK